MTDPSEELDRPTPSGDVAGGAPNTADDPTFDVSQLPPPPGAAPVNAALDEQTPALDPMPVPASPDAPPPTQPEPPADPPSEPPAPADSTPPPAADSSGPASRVAQWRAQVEHDGPGLVAGNQDEFAAQRVIAEQTHRLRMASLLWGEVQNVLSIVQKDATLQHITNHLELTRDPLLDRRQREALFAGLTAAIAQARLNLGSAEQAHQVMELVYDELLGISVVGPFWRDDDITEIMVDGWNAIRIERNGTIYPTPVTFRNAEHADSVARALARTVSDRQLSPSNPIVTAELPGARVTFLIDKIVKTGVAFTIRKFRPLMGMDGLLKFGSLTPEMAQFLADVVRSRANILISGGTGTGKTTMINALSGFIPEQERTITIEDAYELRLSHPFWLAFQTKEAASADDEVSISLADLLVVSLRMRPDRIIVGEVREGSAASVFLSAANTGHDGSMTTIHANSADRALNFRLAGLVRTGAGMSSTVAANEVASAIDVVVQVVRRRGKRFISEISTVDINDVKGDVIRTRPVFRGELNRDEQVVQARVGDVGADTELADKMIDVGVGQQWIEETR